MGVASLLMVHFLVPWGYSYVCGRDTRFIADRMSPGPTKPSVVRIFCITDFYLGDSS